MKVPEKTFQRLKELLWQIADERNWSSLSDMEKTSQYELWLADDSVGGILGRYLEPENVRVYIKDTLMKPYGRERIKDFEPIASALRLPQGVAVKRKYIKPHGRMLSDNRVICWGRCRDWKLVLMAVYERAYEDSGAPFAAVILGSTGRCGQPQHRAMIVEAAEGLGIADVIWHD